MFKSVFRLALIAALGGCLAFAADAQESRVDPKARAVLDQMVAAYKGLTAFHEKMSFKASGSGANEIMENNSPHSLELRLQKPNKLWINQTERRMGKLTRRQVVSDGANLWRWEGESNTYSRSKAPDSFAGIPNLPDDMPELDILFRGEDPLKKLNSDAGNVTVALGQPMKVGDVDVDVVEIKITPQDAPFSATIRFLIGQKDHLMRGLVFEGNGKNPATGQEMNFKAEMTNELVNPAPTFTAADFAFTPPPGAKPESSRSAAPPKPGKKPAGGKKGKKG